ncbi:hypothetical protein GJ744_012045 [Endocarpon pusillum]|uniref:Amidase domain-containing protein n=1 Tax=Endocarpon pusillum TaxID=364733 RepID=A0A8H7ARI7_9EURO|nr:hypothetical protein GJ744_012045 [Endocarpon pusillum]
MGARYTARQTAYTADCDRRISVIATKDGHSMESGTLHGFFTVLEYDRRENLNVEWLESCISQALERDDVLRKEFLTTILINGLPSLPSAKGDFATDVRSLLTAYETKYLELHCEAQDIAPGPYARKTGSIWQVHRLYNDTHGAFLLPVKQVEGRRFEAANDSVHEWDNCAVAVPSRLTVSKSSTKPLSGWRVALKDAFDLEGVRTSMCNRAYLQLYPPASCSADAVATIVDKGALVLGKTKLSMFLSREEPSESVDYQTAWNPRGDGYQGPGGSSSGSAAVVAAYDWIDIGIANGSIRRPGQCNGVFGLRPSRDAVPSKGMFTIFDHFDVPGIFARDFRKLSHFAFEWYADVLRKRETNNLHHSVVLITDSLPGDTASQTQLVTEFARDLATFLKVEVRPVSMTALWEQTTPTAANGKSLHNYLREVGANTFLYLNYHAAAGFRDQYYEEYGRKPFISPFVEWRWSIGKKYGPEDYADGMERMRVYGEWFLRRFSKLEV